MDKCLHIVNEVAFMVPSAEFPAVGLRLLVITRVGQASSEMRHIDEETMTRKISSTCESILHFTG